MTSESLTQTRAVGTANGVDDTNLAYILAVSFTGSTLLAMLLGSQQDAITVGEMRVPSLSDPDSYLCSCGQQIKKCQFWNEVSKRMAQRGISDFDITDAKLSIHDAKSPYVRRLLDPLPRGAFLETVRKIGLSLSPEWRGHLRNVQERNSKLVEVLKEITGTKVVIDSSKIALHLTRLQEAPALKIKVIWLVRDGRAVTNSMLGHGTKSVAEAALSWRRNNEAAQRVLADMPKNQWVLQKYEDLCRAPEETLRTLCKFLGMDAQQIVLDFRAKQQHLLGNDMRLKSGSEIRVDERWRTKLSKEDLATFEEVAGDMNKTLGYQ
jgi:hypothetical protein